jgi:glycosyltransferase involved in cell wall biosynthesis
MSARSLQILGIRGIPAQHGGFETFAEHLAPHLVRKGWDVTVYCQTVASGQSEAWEDRWRGVRRIHIPVGTDDELGSLVFDYKSIRQAARRQGLVLVLGYNTACLTTWLRLSGQRMVTNMDGIEWRRAKWSLPFKAWFYLNEWIGSRVSHHLIADHPEIARHLATRADRSKITMIPYGAAPIDDPRPEPLAKLGLEPRGFLVSICRPEPENSLLELVRAYSRSPRGKKLVILGKFSKSNEYHRAVRGAAGSEILFPGAIYDADTVQALRGHAYAYCHGHTVGGTNPSLVEALGAGNAVIAHENAFNRWVAGDEQFYFADEAGCRESIEQSLTNEDRVMQARAAARKRYQERFTWDDILDRYEDLLERLSTDAIRGTQPSARPAHKHRPQEEMVASRE